MRAVFSVCNYSDIPKNFITIRAIVSRYGFRPEDIKNILGAECNPCIKVKYNGAFWYYYEVRQFEKFVKLLMRCLDERGKLVSLTDGLGRIESEKIFDESPKIQMLKKLAKQVEVDGTSKETILRYFKNKIIKWEEQSAI